MLYTVVLKETYNKANVQARNMLANSKKGSILSKFSDFAPDLAVIVLSLVLIVVIIAQFQSSTIITDGSVAYNITRAFMELFAQIPAWVEISFYVAVGVIIIAAVKKLKDSRN